uniref:Uncharacterized protein n=1 Tax=Anguilla anguilla TaxID=7936 RepID=A0A0E9PXA0_ANGAN
MDFLHQVYPVKCFAVKCVNGCCSFSHHMTIKFIYTVYIIQVIQ